MRTQRLIYLFLPFPFLFYWYTCLPSIGLGDSALFLDEIHGLKFSTWVNSHNLTILLGWLLQWVPAGDLAYRLNLVGVLAAGACVGVFYLCLYRLHRSWISALVPALFLMFSHSTWWMVSAKQEHAVDALLLAMALYAYTGLQQSKEIKYLYFIFFLSGLAFFNNMEMGCLFGGVSVALLWYLITTREIKAEAVLRAAGYFLIGFLPYLLVFTHDASLHGFSLTASGALGGGFRKFFFKEDLWHGLKDYAYLVFMQFPSLYLVPVILGPYFFFKSWKLTPSSMGILFTFIPIMVFFTPFDVWDKFLFMNPSFIILCFCSSFAVHKAVQHPWMRSFALRVAVTGLIALSLGWNACFYGHLARWGQNPKSVWYQAYNNNFFINCYRNNEFLANPNKRNYHDIEDFCNLVLDKLPAYAEYWENDCRLAYQLIYYYQGVYHRRRDLDIHVLSSLGFVGESQEAFAEHVRRAYKANKNFFLVALSAPIDSFLQAIPDRPKYVFEPYYLDRKRWIYKLVTEDEKKHGQKTSWGRWELLPVDRPVTIDLKLDNVLSFNEGSVSMQENMASFGPWWMDNDQVFFYPDKPGAELGFLLRFGKAFEGRLVLRVSTSSDFGIAEIRLNDNPLATKEFDLYSANPYFKDIIFDNVPFEKGNNILSIRMVDRDEKSSGLKIGIDSLRIIPKRN